MARQHTTKKNVKAVVEASPAPATATVERPVEPAVAKPVVSAAVAKTALRERAEVLRKDRETRQKLCKQLRDAALELIQRLRKEAEAGEVELQTLLASGGKVDQRRLRQLRVMIDGNLKRVAEIERNLRHNR